MGVGSDAPKAARLSDPLIRARFLAATAHGWTPIRVAAFVGMRVPDVERELADDLELQVLHGDMLESGRYMANIDFQTYQDPLAAAHEHRDRMQRLYKTGGKALSTSAAIPDRLLTGMRSAFLERVSETGAIAASARAVGLVAHHVDRMRAEDEDFERSVQDALELFAGHLEAHALERATIGREEDVWHNGRPVGKKRTPSDPLLKRMLEARHPAYKTKVEIDATGAGGVMFFLPTAPPSEEEWFRQQDAQDRPRLTVVEDTPGEQD